MSGSQLLQSYNPFKADKPQSDGHTEAVTVNYVYNNKPKQDFSQRLNELLTEKTALKIDYHEIHRDLKSFGFEIKPTETKDFNSGLDIIRLKAGLHIMDVYFQDMHDGKANIDDHKEYFQKQVCRVFEILSRDYERLSETLSKNLNNTEKFNLPDLEKQLQNHIGFYNHFSHLIEGYLNYVVEKSF